MRKNRLTQTYNDIKHTAVNSVTVNSNAAVNFASLHRKFRIQKDRFVTWGLAWNDEEKGLEGSIDEAVVKAGLSETVGSILNNIKEVFEQAERIATHSTTPTSKDDEKPFPTSVPFQYDEAKFTDLLNDLTVSVDTLYDLSRSRKALARGEHPRFKSGASSIKSTTKPEKKASAIPKRLHTVASFESLSTTLVDPPSIKTQSFSRPTLSPYVGLPPRIEMNALELPLEGPPPYEAIGVPTCARVMARLLRKKVVPSVHEALGSDDAEVPVIIEYCEFDSTYRETGVSPPLQRLETVARAFRPMRPESQTNLSMIGYFEDENQPRIGLIYDLPYAVQQMLRGTKRPDRTTSSLQTPLSLLKLVQKDRSSSGDGAAPALEDRFRLALRLTEQLQAIHELGTPHGNVNSSSVIFPVTATEPFSSRHSQMRFPLWASCDILSKDRFEGRDKASNLNIYKHPSQQEQTTNQSDVTDIKYDLYGLALLLLEIGLWHPLSDLYKTKYTLTDFQARLEKLWAPKLAAKCGTPYMRAVQAYMEVANTSHEDRSAIKIVYEQALHNLRRCCMISENEGPPSDYLGPNLHSSVIQEWQSRRQHTLSSEDTFLTAHASTTADKLRTQTETPPETPATSFAFPHESSVLPTAATGSADDNPLTRRTSPLATLHEIKDHAIDSLHSASASSFQDMKQKVTLIQQSWREHSQRCKERQEARARVSASAPTTRHQDRSTTTEPRPVRKEFALSMPPEMMEEWHTKTMGQLSRLVERALKGSPESCSIAFTHYGETAETARPTYLVHCASTAKVKQVLRKHFQCESCPYDVKVKKGKIKRSRRSGRADSGLYAARSMAPSADDGAANPFYQERPLCGASIGAYKDDEHLPPVTFGGVVLIEDAPYGMSVHHMLEQDIAEEQGETDDDDSSETSSIGSVSDNEDNVTLPISEDDSTVKQLSTNSDDSIDMPVNENTPGYLPGEIFDIEITQPALEDAISCDLHADIDEDDEDGDSQSAIDDDHLLSFKLGAIHASSGLKRTNTHSTEEGYKGIITSLPQEIDWALFEVLPPRVHPFNVIKNGSQYCSTSPSPACASDSITTSILPSSALPGASVHCFGRTSGLGHGTVSQTMDLVKIHGRSTFSASWSVKGDFGIGGDSGAWVISNETGGVCGHVLAERNGKTYICPMELILEDIKATLGAGKVGLPGVDGRMAVERGDEDMEGNVNDGLTAKDQAGVATTLPDAEDKAAGKKLDDEETAGESQAEKTNSVIGTVAELSLEDVDTDSDIPLTDTKKAKRCMAPGSRRMIPA